MSSLLKLICFIFLRKLAKNKQILLVLSIIDEGDSHEIRIGYIFTFVERSLERPLEFVSSYETEEKKFGEKGFV